MKEFPLADDPYGVVQGVDSKWAFLPSRGAAFRKVSFHLRIILCRAFIAYTPTRQRRNAGRTGSIWTEAVLSISAEGMSSSAGSGRTGHY